jgi:hypothetical protein
VNRVQHEEEEEEIYTVDQKINGITYTDLIKEWCNWLYDTPRQSNASVDYKGINANNEQKIDKVFFLSGTFGGHADRHSDIPEEKNLFFPIMVSTCRVGEFAKIKTRSQLSSKVKSETNSVIQMTLTLDEEVYYHKDLLKYRAKNTWFDLGIHKDSVIGGSYGKSLIPGSKKKAAADGYWVGIKPLPKGDHTIHFFATAKDGYTQDVTYFLHIKDR